MSFGLEDLTVEELEAVIADAKKHIAHHEAKSIHNAYLEVVQIASRQGMSIEELVTVGRRMDGKSKPASTGKKVEAKYHNPENNAQTWTGRGRTPLWISEKIAAGANLNDFLISK